MDTSSAPPPTGPLDALSMRDVVAGLEENRRAMASLQAREMQLLGRAGAIAAEQTERIPVSAQRERELPLRSIAAEVGAALRRSDRGMQGRIHQAAALLVAFPAVIAALHQGRIDVAHVRVIDEAGSRIADAEARGLFEQAALLVAERETPGRARPIIVTLAQRIDPAPLTERHADAAAARRVWVRDLEDGMAELVALLPAVLAHGIHDRVHRTARALRDAAALERGAGGGRAPGGRASGGRVTSGGEPGVATSVPDAGGEPADCRTIDQRRADVLADLLLTGHATAEASDATICETEAIVAHVQVTVPAATLAGGDAPASIPGHGPLDAETARHLAGGASSWDRLFIDSTTGAVRATDCYRPSLAQRRQLRARDEHCRFPGCRSDVWICDIDHTVDHAHGGPTRCDNLARLCRRHHMLKHHSAWTVVQRPAGVLEWTSPAGRVYPDVPRRALEFTAAIAAGVPPPF
ncbi:HNH endonuclease signature motif containing protein [Microbacterium jiangjiandongii]|uniref:HNH endonuclease signature motif containing protein n=1 Tax=Microbacterium jiangjiandongii TaxID=3049071 RepID=UPI00214A9011|nr:HNH endonuclease signature motif containing protein [Microbacterium sp. zg.Y843]MCR2816698.1 HNH endonuclease [Microbacterium sp. zg.Y843]